MTLLERDEHLRILARHLDECAIQGGRLVLLEGEAGIGKTSLLTRFRGTVPDGTRALLGVCDPLSTPRPFGPWLDIAPSLDPRFAGLLRTSPPPPRTEILAALLTALAEPGGSLVVMLDDLHWADDATRDALRFVGRRIGSTRALVVGTYRDDEVGADHPLRIVLGDLATSPSVHRLALRALSVRAVGVLAQGSGLDPVELHRHTAGNPFYVTEVVAGAPARIPPTVRDAVLARAARLSPAGRRTLQVAAVIGPAIEPALLSTILGTDTAAEECLSRGVLRTDGLRYFFRHEVAREAIVAAIDPGLRQSLHGRVLAALEAGSSDLRPLARLAHHAEGAGDADAVQRYAPAAALEAVEAGSHREAAAQYARALRFAGRLPDRERAELLERYAVEHATIARLDLANTAWAEAIAAWERLGDTKRQSMALAGYARSLIIAGRDPEAEDASRRALEVLGPTASGRAAVEALAVRSYLRMLSRHNEEAVELGRRTIELGAGDPESAAAIVLAWNTVGSARILLGDYDGGRVDLERSLRLAREQSMDRHVSNALSNLVSALGEMYRFADSDPYFEEGHRFTTDRDLDSTRLYLESWRALSLMYRGRWTEAEAMATSILAGNGRAAISRTMALLALGRIRARRGDDDAWPTLDEALAIAEPTGTLQRIGPVRAARAEAAWLAGDLARCAAEAGAAMELALSRRHPWHVGELGWWLAQAGRPAADTSAAAEPWRLQLAGRADAAAAAWAALDCPYESARAALDAGDVAAVEAAHARFDRLGARPAAALAARRLRQLGAARIPRGAREATRSNPAGLTGRELEVLALMAAGLHNHEIAARLVLSTRTVDHHVSAILGKLGVSRRTDAASAARRLGIDPEDGHPVPPE
ncbi:MAG TPA: AAA family ATPase [Candidatus Limnocylindria bacterium]|nr:AAA family ATPase [Candidatus Limnocylindria bacterium]